MIDLFTSLNPYELVRQPLAIKSWNGPGVKLNSLNTNKEIVVLKEQYPQIKFHEVNKTGVKIYAKPFIFISDFKKVIKKSSCDVVGIVNGDIILGETSVLENASKYAKKGLVVAHRTDIKHQNDLEGKEYRWGYDFFAFPARSLNYLKPHNFCLASTWWDYLLPLTFIKKGLPVYQLPPKVIRHIEHENQWSWSQWYKNGWYLYGKYRRAINKFIKDLELEIPEEFSYLLNSSGRLKSTYLAKRHPSHNQYLGWYSELIVNIVDQIAVPAN